MCWSWYRRYIIMVYFTRSSYQKACNLFILVMMRELAGDNLKITPIGFLESLFCVQIWYWVLPYPSIIELNCIFIIFNDLKKYIVWFFKSCSFEIGKILVNYGNIFLLIFENVFSKNIISYFDDVGGKWETFMAFFNWSINVGSHFK